MKEKYSQEKSAKDMCSFSVDKGCCNIKSYGEICVQCGLCQQAIVSLKAGHLKQIMIASRLLTT